MTYQDAAKQLTRTSFNVIDVLVFVLVVMPCVVLARRLGVNTSGGFYGIAAIVLGPMLFFYVARLRPHLFGHPLVQKLVPRPVDPKLRPRFSPLGFLAVLFIYPGFLILGLTAYFFLAPIPEPSPVTQAEVAKLVDAKLEQENLFGLMEAMGNAKPVAAEDLGSAEPTTFEEIENQIAADNAPKRDQIREEITTRLTQERESEYRAALDHEKRQAVRFLLLGLAMVLVGGVLDKVNNLLVLAKA